MSNKEEAAKPEISTASSWKKTSPVAAPHEIEVPSGNVCLAKRPGMGAFLTAGLIPNSLMPIVSKAMEGKGVSDKQLSGEMSRIMQDPTKIQEMFDLVDAVVIHVVVQPEMLPKPEHEEMRHPDKLYVDEVDEEDKLFLFNWAVGGTSDLERFRAEQAELLEPVSPGEDVVSPPKRSGRAKR